MLHILRQTASGNIVMNERVDRFRLGEKWMDLPVAGVFEVGDDGLEEGLHLARVEPAKARRELVLPDLERGEAHL